MSKVEQHGVQVGFAIKAASIIGGKSVGIVGMRLPGSLEPLTMPPATARELAMQLFDCAARADVAAEVANAHLEVRSGAAALNGLPV